ncbi:AAA family ATPase [Calidithermus chliarophilus]|uniref:AAA family ATPase n=1 Tax=Calidithermus chliarophilus TaxID=52023 RepID=UPI00040A398F|nr:AAA family ATPase [Calidithermus chliarophilus]
MAGGQTLRILTVGKSGCGKSTLNRQLIGALEGRFAYLVVCNVKREFSDLVGPRARFTVSDAKAVSEEALFRLIVEHRRVFFQVIDPEPWHFMDRLGRVLMRLRFVLCVVDEAHNLLPEGKPCRGFILAITGGREQGLSFLFVTQSIVTSSGGLNLTVQKQVTHYITFQLTEFNEVRRMAVVFPELGERVRTLKRPSPTDPNPPEYAVRDMDKSLANLVLRDPADPRRRRVVSL